MAVLIESPNDGITIEMWKGVEHIGDKLQPAQWVNIEQGKYEQQLGVDVLNSVKIRREDWLEVRKLIDEAFYVVDGRNE